MALWTRRATWQLGRVAWTASSLSLCGFLLTGAGLTYATAGEVGRLTRLVRPTPPEVATDVIVRNVRDSGGQRASFRILLLTDEYRWQLSSYDRVDGDGAEPEFSPRMRTLLNGAREIICVGASSEEIVPGLSGNEGRVREEIRAARRARRLAAWVERAISRPVPVRMLNIGHHESTRHALDTSDQRRAIIILVLDRDEGTNLDEALRAAMLRERERTPVFDHLLTRYSLGGGTTFTWVQ